MRILVVTSPIHRRAALGAQWVMAFGAIAGLHAMSQPATTAVPVPAGSIRVDAVAVPLHPSDRSVTAIGDFIYAGGLALTSRQTNRLHEMSDLAIGKDDRMTAVSDAGSLFDARLTFDAAGKLSGVTDAHITPLSGEDGRPLTGRAVVNAEGLAILPDGDRLVSFERQHRIWLYPGKGGPPRAVPSPRTSFASNAGMEALTAMPDVAADAYMVGNEATGETWTCRLRATCVKGSTIQKAAEFGLVSLHRLPDGRTACLLRAFDPVKRSRVILRVLQATTVIAEMDITQPLTVDNFEGLTSTPARDGQRRFYLLSDDNASPDQRTLLLAFDWRPR